VKRVPLKCRTHLQSLATWTQKLRSPFEVLRLDDIGRYSRRVTAIY